MTKAGDELLVQVPFGVCVDGGVDRLVGHVQRRLVGPERAQCPHDLLGRPEPAEYVSDQRPLSRELARRAGTGPARKPQLLGLLRPVASFQPQVSESTLNAYIKQSVPLSPDTFPSIMSVEQLACIAGHSAAFMRVVQK